MTDHGPTPDTTPAIRLTREDAGLGTFAVRDLDPLADTELLFLWVTHPKAAFWLMGEATLPEIERAYMSIAAAEHQDAFLGLHEGQPAFLVERYDPAHVELKGLYDPEPGDVGMHFLTAPTSAPLHGFSLGVLVTVMDFLFSDPATARVVVEPDVRNTAVHALNEAVGFEVVTRIAKPEKDALLSVCTRERYEAARAAVEGVSAR
ncbi:GNAT family N-acetyltransferase [Streptomyces tsukubensis]|uniref:Lysine N-acyltransferase MbtK n=1 Tax=Streptomyces tsukubensis TaxID=83656 RepID=A0A1V3ZZB9_9ACTN|nr:GNAT family N-acetyltransferase [Streptomyces tsukubensis]OON71836.1 GNAT family N-acetyltransferase [Streptomyces tsukubensis]QFR93678.1 GNAT family N-acetyltransferase [Streptomyces tsukubensis]